MDRICGYTIADLVIYERRLRVVEHNVLVVSKYYSRITTKRLATLLCLSEEEVCTPIEPASSP